MLYQPMWNKKKTLNNVLVFALTETAWTKEDKGSERLWFLNALRGMWRCGQTIRKTFRKDKRELDEALKNGFSQEMSPELFEESTWVSQTKGQRHSRKKNQKRNQNTDMRNCTWYIKRGKKSLSGGWIWGRNRWGMRLESWEEASGFFHIMETVFDGKLLMGFRQETAIFMSSP